MTPTPEVRAELESHLDDDTSRTGDVHRLLDEGLTDQQIADRLGVGTANFVWNQRVILRTLLDGEIPQSPSVVAQVSRKIRTVMRSDMLSPASKSYLQDLLNEMPVSTPQATSDSTQNMRETRARLRLAMELLADEPSGYNLDELYELVTAVYPRASDSDPSKSPKTGFINFSHEIGSITYAGWANLYNSHLWLTAAGRRALQEYPDADGLLLHADELSDDLNFKQPLPPPTPEELATWIAPIVTDPLVRRAAGETLALGLGEGKSVIDPEAPAWSAATVEDLRSRYNGQLDMSSGRSFLDKLEGQLAGAPDATILLAAELINLLQLPLENVGQKTKASRIRRMMTWLTEPRGPGPLLTFAWYEGSWHGGTGSNTMLWRALFDMVEFLREWWQRPEDERTAALEDPWEWSRVLQSGTLTMPSTSHALRYLGFPAYFLPIVNADHKNRIRKAFLPEIPQTTGDLEKDLFSITLAIQQRTGAAVDYYSPALKQRWDPQTPVTARAWLVRGSSVQGQNLVPTWVRDRFISLPAAMLEEVPEGADRDAISSAVQAAFANRAADYQRQKVDEYDAFLRVMAPGDLVITTADGLVYVGEITGGSRWDTETALPARLRRPVTWSRPEGIDFVDLPDPLPARLTANENVTDLTDDRAVIAALITDTTPSRRTGLEPPTEELAADLHLPLEWLQRVTRLMQRRKALILFGPPGTGKTYVAQELTKHWTDPGNTDLVQFHPSVTTRTSSPDTGRWTATARWSSSCGRGRSCAWPSRPATTRTCRMC